MCSNGRFNFDHPRPEHLKHVNPWTEAIKREMNATILASAKKSADPPTHAELQKLGVDVVHPPWMVFPDVPQPTSWPYTLHDTEESPFNLNHGYMWGRFAGFGG